MGVSGVGGGGGGVYFPQNNDRKELQEKVLEKLIADLEAFLKHPWDSFPNTMLITPQDWKTFESDYENAFRNSELATSPIIAAINSMHSEITQSVELVYGTFGEYKYGINVNVVKEGISQLQQALQYVKTH